MNEDNDVENRVAVASLLTSYPPVIRSALLSRESFRHTFGIEADCQFTFGDTGISVSRSALLKGVRSVLNNPPKKTEIEDVSGNKWIVKAIDKKLGQIKLSRGSRNLILPEMWMLIQNKSERIFNLNNLAKDLNFPKNSHDFWKEIIELGPLLDDELDDFLEDIKATPVHLMRKISAEVKEGSCSFQSLVPRDARYFYRLVGESGQNRDLKSHVENDLRKHIKNLTLWDTSDGIKQALLLSSHSSIPTKIDISATDPDTLATIFGQIQKEGDRLSQLGAIELGFSILDKQPQLEPAILDMIGQICNDHPSSRESRFRLLSALIVMVDGEVSRTKILRKMPPFWRRLATITQAALIERCFCSFNVNIDSFTEWANFGRGQQFYLQTLCDLRLEPKWIPDFIDPEQLKAQFIGRIADAAQKNRANLTSSELTRICLSEEDNGVRSQIRLPMSFFPGPLEGGTTSEVEIPSDLAESIDEALSQEIVDGKSFIGLVNSALVFNLDSKFADQAVLALKRAKHYLKQKSKDDSLFHLISGLASVAAVTRNPQLSDELRILIRRSKSVGAIDVSADDLFRINMIAAASHQQLSEWCLYVGEGITELAYSDISIDEAIRLHSHLLLLCKIVPELWTTLGQAEAALSATLKV